MINDKSRVVEGIRSRLAGVNKAKAEKGTGLADGMSKEAAAAVLALSDAGLSTEEAADVIKRAASGSLGKEEVSNLMTRLKRSAGDNADAMNKLAALESALRDGSLKAGGDGLSAESLRQAADLAKVMRKAGYSDKEVGEVLAKATGGGLNEKDADELLKKVLASPKLSDEERKKARSVCESIKAGDLRAAKVSADSLDAALNLRDALEKAGLPAAKAAEAVARIAASGATPEDAADIVARAAAEAGLDPAATRAATAAAAALANSGGLSLPGASQKDMERLALLRTTLAAAGFSKDEADKFLAKAVNQGLSQKETNDVINKALSSGRLKAEDKNRLNDLKEALTSNTLKKRGGATGKDLVKGSAVQRLLDDANLSDADAERLMEKLARGDPVSDTEIKGLVSKALKKKGISSEDFEAAAGLIDALGSGSLAGSGTGGAPPLTADELDDVLLLRRTMEASGFSPEEASRILTQATGARGLGEAATRKMMERLLAADSGVSKEDRERLKALFKRTGADSSSNNGGGGSGGLKIGGGGANAAEAALRSMDPAALARAILAQRLLARSGLSQDDLARLAALQRTLLDCGAPADKIARAVGEAAAAAGVSLDHALKLAEIELRSAVAGSGSGRLSASDVSSALAFEKVLGSSELAEEALRKLQPKQRKLLHELIKAARDEAEGGKIKKITVSKIGVLKRSFSRFSECVSPVSAESRRW
jgi:predicted secreted protein